MELKFFFIINIFKIRAWGGQGSNARDVLCLNAHGSDAWSASMAWYGMAWMVWYGMESAAL